MSRPCRNWRTAVAVLIGPALIALLSIAPRPTFPHAATTNTVLFDREIVRILNEHCVMCHQTDGLAVPFETYEQVWLNRDAIHDEVLARRMPLWTAVSGYGKFSNANELTLRETRFLVSWVEGLGPRNNGSVFLNVLDPSARAPRVIRSEFDADRWRLGPPDSILDLPAPAPLVSGDSSLQVLRGHVDVGSNSQRWLNALEYHPADRRFIRAVEFTLESTGQWLGTWTPWHGYRRLPEHAAYLLPAGARIRADFFVTGDTQALTNAGELGLHFAGEPPASAPRDVLLEVTNLVAGGSQRQRLETAQVLDRDTSVLALWPMLPTGTESIEVRASRPGGEIEILLLAVDIAVDWPTPYLPETPVLLPGGTELVLIAYLSNAGPNAVERRVRLVVSAE